MAIAERTDVEVLDRHRRRPPLLPLAVVVAVFLGLSAATAGGVAAVGLGIAAVGVVGVGIGARRRIWAEDQLVTAVGVAIARPDGTVVDVPFPRITAVAASRRRLRFTRDDGATLDFTRNPHATRIRGLLAARAPHADWAEEIDPACDT